MLFVTFYQNSQPVGQILADRHVFRTGSRGFYGHGKIALPDGKRYQVNVQLVEIGSKSGGNCNGSSR